MCKNNNLLLGCSHETMNFMGETVKHHHFWMVFHSRSLSHIPGQSVEHLADFAASGWSLRRNRRISRIRKLWWWWWWWWWEIDGQISGRIRLGQIGNDKIFPSLEADSIGRLTSFYDERGLFLGGSRRPFLAWRKVESFLATGKRP